MADDGLLAGVVGGEGERHVVVEARHESLEMAHSTIDVVARIERVLHVEVGRRGRHELHEPLRAAARNRAGVELRLDGHDGGDELGLDAVARGDLDDMGVDVDRRGA